MKVAVILCLIYISDGFCPYVTETYGIKKLSMLNRVSILV